MPLYFSACSTSQLLIFSSTSKNICISQPFIQVHSIFTQTRIDRHSVPVFTRINTTMFTRTKNPKKKKKLKAQAHYCLHECILWHALFSWCSAEGRHCWHDHYAVGFPSHIQIPCKYWIQPILSTKHCIFGCNLKARLSCFLENDSLSPFCFEPSAVMFPVKSSAPVFPVNWSSHMDLTISSLVQYGRRQSGVGWKALTWWTCSSKQGDCCWGWAYICRQCGCKHQIAGASAQHDWVRVNLCIANSSVHQLWEDCISSTESNPDSVSHVVCPQGAWGNQCRPLPLPYCRGQQSTVHCHCYAQVLPPPTKHIPFMTLWLFEKQSKKMDTWLLCIYKFTSLSFLIKHQSCQPSRCTCCQFLHWHSKTSQWAMNDPWIIVQPRSEEPAQTISKVLAHTKKIQSFRPLLTMLWSLNSNVCALFFDRAVDDVHPGHEGHIGMTLYRFSCPHSSALSPQQPFDCVLVCLLMLFSASISALHYQFCLLLLTCLCIVHYLEHKALEIDCPRRMRSSLLLCPPPHQKERRRFQPIAGRETYAWWACCFNWSHCCWRRAAVCERGGCSF